jgi:DNA modification methylase
LADYQIINRAVERLVPYPGNARTHSQDQIAQIAASIKEFGWTNPCLIDGNDGLIAGHGRALAAKSLGMTEVPCIVLDHLTDAQRRALILADNKLALNAGWDEDILRAELAALAGLDFDIGLIGFAEAEIRALQALGTADGNTDPDDVPEPPVEPVSRLGDIWELGGHRILCGSSTEPEAVAAVLDGDKPHLMVTDPPYGVNYDPKWRDDLGIDWTGQGEKKKQRLSTHPNATPTKSRSLGKVENDDRADWTEAWDLFPGNIAYVWHGGLHAAEVQKSLESSKFAVRAQIIWVKQHFVFSRGDYHWQHEPCWYAVRGAGNWEGDRKQTTVWEISNASAFHGEKGDQITGHGTQKPVECMKRPIENNSAPGDLVYEPFSGSGTTIIAGEMTKRYVRAIELNPCYVDVAVQRWEAFAGQQATLRGDGRTFAEVSAERLEPVAS